MIINKSVLVLCCAVVLGICGCSRQQSDWQKTRESNTTDAYEQFLKKYPSGEFTAQAQARVKELYEERDWQKARDADTPEAYQAFLKQYPEGKWTEEARIRLENFTLAQTPSGSGAAGAAAPPGAPGAAPNSSPSSPAAAKPPAAPKPPVAAKPPVAPTSAMTAKPAETTPSSKAAPGAYAVQLGAFKSGAGAADRRWTHLQKEYPELLAGLSSKVVPKKTSTGTLYRLQAVGATEKRAHAICKHLKAKSQPCIVLRPAHA
jgi:cell division protein FtsN